ncbi:hypothetical protein QYE76_010562 [Lolium multiflorum]|uniref:Reverse transcriptase domain-containing protein n=1 Tax=Lolium multiflorum TaxID=4521 RepID=A0AAD8TTU8_LOLMU|nr:hypothetical protein QYE76_010562 [Lolium multiflorum]
MWHACNSQDVCRTLRPSPEGPGPTSGSGSLPALRVARRCSPVSFGRQHLVDENWNWQVRQLSATDFAVVFPSKESLRIAIRGGRLTLPSSKIKALVTVPLGYLLASETLEEVWVKLIGVPPPLRFAERLLLSTREVGRPISVDLDSLAHPEAPIRIPFGCRKDDVLPESITLFVNLQGYRIRVICETPAADDSPPHAPPRFPPGDGNDDKEDDCDETDEDRWDGRRGKHLKDKRATASAPSAGGGGPRKSVPLAAAPSSPSASLPDGDAALNLRIPASACSRYGTNLTSTGNIFPLVAQIIKASVPTSSEHQSSDLSDSELVRQLDLADDPGLVEKVSPTQGKAKKLSEAEREEVGWVTPPSASSDQEYRRDSERRSKSNHDRPSRKLMLEVAATLSTEETQPTPPVLGLHLAPALSLGGSPPLGQLLLLDAPIPALGAAVARAPRSKELALFVSPKGMWAGASPWERDDRVSEEENVALAYTFSETELEAIVKEMKTDTAPGPDGFPVAFFKKLWPQVKLGILHMLNDFVLGRIDIARLNFGIISLIPKVPGADQITQFRPISLISVIFKIIYKAYASRLDPIANQILSPNQTAFIKGRNILDGPLALMETIHDLRKRKHNGVLLKLDFEKAYDRVNWDFLGEVLRCKGFDEGYIHRITQLVSGGQTAISINGEVGRFFEIREGFDRETPSAL